MGPNLPVEDFITLSQKTNPEIIYVSIIYIDNLSAYNNKGDGIDAFRTNLTVKNSTIKDNEGQGIALHNVSNLKFDSSIISSNKGISI